MCANQWGVLPYSRVPSRCMALNRKAFRKHDDVRFNKFIEDAKAGITKVKGNSGFSLVIFLLLTFCIRKANVSTRISTILLNQEGGR